jgi:hypothetical protein
MTNLPRLSEDRIRTLAPSVFASAPHGSRSDRFAFVPTYDVVRGLETQGFFPVAAQEIVTRDASRRGFAKHLIRFRQENAPVVAGTALELVMINGHDGSTRYKFFAGAYRFVCANGLMVGKTFGEFSAMHTGNVVEECIRESFRVASFFPKVVQNIGAMESVRVDVNEQLRFASAALLAKYNPTGEEGVHVPLLPAQILRPRRTEDARAPYASTPKEDLYTTYNVIQENLVRGGIPGVSVNAETGRRRRTRSRAIESIDGAVDLNQKLWDLATKMAEANGAKFDKPSAD